MDRSLKPDPSPVPSSILQTHTHPSTLLARAPWQTRYRCLNGLLNCRAPARCGEGGSILYLMPLLRARIPAGPFWAGATCAHQGPPLCAHPASDTLEPSAPCTSGRKHFQEILMKKLFRNRLQASKGRCRGESRAKRGRRLIREDRAQD